MRRYPGLSLRLRTAAPWLLLLLAAAVLLVPRTLFGVDLSDEGIYAAEAHRFALGARPLLQEWDLHQSATWLTTPLVMLWYRIVPDGAYLILFLRTLYVALMFGVAAAWRSALVRFVGERISTVAAMLVLVVIPYCIPAPSYNTLGIAFAAIGLALYLLAVEKSSRTRFALAGASLGIAAIAYPTFALLAPALAGVHVIWSRRVRDAIALLLGALIVWIPPLAIVFMNREAIPAVLEYYRVFSASFGWGGGISEVGGLFVDAARAIFARPVFLLLLVVVSLRVMRRKIPALIWLMIPATAWLSYRYREMFVGASSLAFLVGFVLVALAAGAVRLVEEGEDRRVVRTVVVVGLVAMILAGYTSANAATAMGLGAWTFAPLIIALSMQALSQRYSEKTALIAVAALLVFIAASNMLVGYRDVRPIRATTAVTKGPYAGLVTTPERAAAVDKLTDDMARYVSDDDVLLVYDELPGVFLFTNAKPTPGVLWIFQNDGIDASLVPLHKEYLAEDGNSPTVIVRALVYWRAIDAPIWYPPQHIFERMAMSNYHVVASGPFYEIRVKNDR